MFGLKGDWSLDIPQRYFILEDYMGAEPRWCPGCGDHGVLTSVQRICRDKQIPPENTVVVSGIGCSSRFPHYMKTYGFHSLHGRAIPVASGVKSRRPELDVWVATGDGDCFSIGSAHWLHAVRYNMNMTVMVFDNNVYGLTKKQTSPTSQLGLKTNTHPFGAVLPPLNPLTVTLGITNVSFVAQVADWNPVMLHAILQAAHDHTGFSLVRILQRCPQYTDFVWEDYQKDPAKLAFLTHENGVQLDDSIKRNFPNHLEHDPSDIHKAREVAEMNDPLPVGILFQDPNRVRYETITSQGLGMSVEDKIKGLNKALDVFAV
jgi:2-oxoglutarate ferredoxin oxidoreductase subunit beta